jgi:beta-glucanase (GH16 family)
VLDYAGLGYTLYQAEEFNGDELDRSRWCTRLVYGGGAPTQRPDAQCSGNGQGTADLANGDDAQRFRDIDANGQPLHVVSNGTLKLRASRLSPEPGVDYVAAAIRSKQTLPSAAGFYYFITSRVRLPDVRGTWPAMALFPSAAANGTVQWPPQVSLFDGPLNASSLQGNSLIRKTVLTGAQTVSGGHEWNYVGPGFDVQDSVFRASQSLRGRWLELGMEWTKGHVCWFINGVPNGCENYEWLTEQGVLANPASLVAYLAVGGGLAGADGIDIDAFPTQLEIDWIRVYRRAGF